MLENSFVLQTINTVKNPDNSLKCSSQFCFVRADMEQTSLKIFNSERRVIWEQGDTFMISHIFTQSSGGIPVHKIIIIEPTARLPFTVKLFRSGSSNKAGNLGDNYGFINFVDYFL